MTVFDIQAEELCLLYEYNQGNPFNGSEYVEILEDGISFVDSGYIVWVDMVSDGLDFSESFTPDHTPYCIIKDGFTFGELFGLPAQVSNSILNIIHTQTARPVDICFFELEVLHGIDIFWEEVSSGLHCVGYDQGVPYHWLTVFESWGFDTPATIVAVTFSESLDRLNMRHEVDQLYNFNNSVNEQLFTYGWPSIAWGKLIEDWYVLTDDLAPYLGFSITEHLFTDTMAGSQWIGNLPLNSTMFAYDVDQQIQGFSESMLETIDMEDLIQSPFIENLMASLGISGDIEKTNAIATLMLKENLRVSTTVALGMSMALGITDSIKVVEGSVLAMVVQDFVETLQDGFGVSVEAAMGFVMSKIIDDTLACNDSPLNNWYLNLLLAESLGTTEDIK